MTSGKHKSKDNDSIFEAYTQHQLDERGGFWDRQLANSPIMKKFAGNMSARAQGRVDSKQTADQITQAFYQSLGRNKGNVDTDQFKSWMSQAVGVEPQYLQSLGNVTKPQMSHNEIKKLIPDVVDQAITAKQSGQAAKPGVAGMSQNTQVAAPQQQTVAPPAGVTPPNPNSQPQQAAVNNPNSQPQGQVQPVQPGTTNVTNVTNGAQPTTPGNENNPGIISRAAKSLGKGAGNVIGGVAGGLAGGAIGGAVAGFNKGKNMLSGDKQTSTDNPNQKTQTTEPPSMTDLTSGGNTSNSTVNINAPETKTPEATTPPTTPDTSTISQNPPEFKDGEEVLVRTKQNPNGTPGVVRQTNPNGTILVSTPGNQAGYSFNASNVLKSPRTSNIPTNLTENILGGSGFMSKKWGNFK